VVSVKKYSQNRGQYFDYGDDIPVNISKAVSDKLREWVVDVENTKKLASHIFTATCNPLSFMSRRKRD
jgi:hypothetical protein